MNRIYTLGYGLLKGTHNERKETFQERLRNIQKQIGKPVMIVDIRRKGAGSRNGDWFSQGYGMCMSVREAMAGKFKYASLPALTNEFGNTKAGLKKYREKLLGFGQPFYDFSSALHWLDKKTDAVVLLCAERQAWGTRWHPVQGTIPTGRPNCHRVILAEELLTHLGDGWEVVHL